MKYNRLISSLDIANKEVTLINPTTSEWVYSFLNMNYNVCVYTIDYRVYIDLKDTYKNVFFDNDLEMLKDNNIIYFISKAKVQNHHYLNILATMNKNSTIYAVGENNSGGLSFNSVGKLAGMEFSKIASISHHSVWKCVKTIPTDLKINIPSSTLSISEKEIYIETDPGVFSFGKIDVGSRLLIDYLEKKYSNDKSISEYNVLDLGCGNGILGIVLAKIGSKNITFTDINLLALRNTEKNCKNNSVINCKIIPSCSGDGIKDDFDLIVLNPPFHDGNVEDRSIIIPMLKYSKEVLKKHGKLILVINSHLNYSEAFKKYFTKENEVVKTNLYRIVELS